MYLYLKTLVTRNQNAIFENRCSLLGSATPDEIHGGIQNVRPFSWKQEKVGFRFPFFFFFFEEGGGPSVIFRFLLSLFSVLIALSSFRSLYASL